MKKSLLFSIVTLFSILLSSCSKDIEPKFETDYDKSLETWETFKRSSNNNYKFITQQNTFHYIGNVRTETIVKNGTVDSRKGYIYIFGDTERPESGWTEDVIDGAVKKLGMKLDDSQLQELYKDLIDSQWTEDQSNIGKNKAQPVYTLDLIYKLAKEEWLIPKKNMLVGFKTENQGMISLAGKSYTNLEDAPFVGIHITSIEKIN